MPDSSYQELKDAARVYAAFKRWIETPNALPQKSPAMENALGAQAMLEEALWAAYQAGYGQGVTDSDGAQRLLSFLKGNHLER